jgi:predicted transcriptional regulator of viral defense system
MTSPRLPDSGRLAGVVTTAELVEAGLAKKSIRALARREILTAVRRGVYARTDLIHRLPGQPQSRDRLLSIAAAVAAAGGDAVASHEDAALIHGIDLLRRPSASLIAVSRPRGRDGVLTGPPEVRIRRTALPASQVTVVYRIPVTSVAKTVVDLARTTPFKSGVVAADSALHRRKTSKAELRSVITTSRRWPGIERARQVVCFGDARSESPFDASTGLSRRPTERSSTRTQTGLAGSYAETPTCAQPGSRSFTSPGPT